MKIALCTYVSNCYYHSMGADKLVRSAKHFHPNIPFLVYGDKEIDPLSISYGLLHPFMIDMAFKEGYDAVIYMDADSMITGPLDELLMALEHDYDVIGVRNNNDYDKAGADNPITQEGCAVDDYWNAGLVATKSRAFVDLWKDYNLSFGSLLPFKEQTVLNVIKRHYKTHTIDNKNSPVYYGVSCLAGLATHWDSLKDIQVEDGALVLNGKRVKVIHHGGGFRENKLGFYMFNNETRERLIEIMAYQ